MIDLMQTVELMWNKSNKRYYIEKGYEYTKNGDTLLVYAKDLPASSHTKVCVCCDICRKKLFTPLGNYNRNIQRNGRYVCQPCSVSVKHEKTLDKRRKDYVKRALVKCVENGYDFLSKEDEITNNTSYIRYRCPVHGEQKMRLSNFLIGRKCPRCNHDAHSSDYRLKYNDVVARVQECGAEILNPEDYINQAEKNLKFKKLKI